MGLLGRLRGGIADPVEGQAEILSMAPTAKSARQAGKLDVDYLFRLRVTAPGLAAYEADHECRVPHERMPVTGHLVPVTVSAADPERLRIEFDRIPRIADRAMASAHAARRGDVAGAAEALGFELRDPPGGG